MNKETFAPKILPVVEPDNVKPKYHHPFLPNVGVDVAGGGALLLMISPVKTGKSTIISNLLLNENLYGQEFFDDVQIISNTIKNDVTSRFLNQAFNVYDYYDDAIITSLIERQKSFEKIDQLQTALILDDCLGSVKRESKINHLASRYRHFNFKLVVISSQKFKGAVSPVIRANATDVIIGSPFPNQKELLAVAEEYGDLFGGADAWLKLYRQCCPSKYDFCYMDLQSNPPIMYHNFEKKVATGGFSTDNDNETNEEENNLKKKEEIKNI